MQAGDSGQVQDGVTGQTQALDPTEEIIRLGERLALRGPVLKFGQQELQLTSRRHNRRLRRSKESEAMGDGNTDEVAETRQQTANAKKPARPLAVHDVQSLKVDHKELKKMQEEDESLKPLWKKEAKKAAGRSKIYHDKKAKDRWLEVGTLG
nr:hypothetical protein BaRGS_025124 [Batillaria attramentaria]